MIKMPDINLQPNASVNITAATTRSTDSPTTGSSGVEGLFQSVLGDSQEVGVTISASTDSIESDQSDQKLMQLEELELTETLMDSETLNPEEKVIELVGKTLVVGHEHAVEKNVQTQASESEGESENVIEEQALELEQDLKPVLESEVEVELGKEELAPDKGQLGVERLKTGISGRNEDLDEAIQKTGPKEVNPQQLNPQQGLPASNTEPTTIHYRSAKPGDQEIFEPRTRPVSLEELRSIRPESQHLRHTTSLESRSLTNVHEVGERIADKSIGMDSLSPKQPYTAAVDFDVEVEESMLLDKFEVARAPANEKLKPDSDLSKLESMLGSAKEPYIGVDAKAAKSVGHTPISIEAIKGHAELSSIAAAGQKTDATLPISTLALRQPGLDQSLAKNISFMINEDIQSANINVKPAELGPVNVQLAVRSDHLSITIAASQLQTRESLESTIPRLREQFSSMGFSSVDVSVGDHQNQRQSDERLSDEKNQLLTNDYLAVDDKGVMEEARIALQPHVSHSGMLDTFA